MALPVTDSASVGVAFPILSRVLTLSQWRLVGVRIAPYRCQPTLLVIVASPVPPRATTSADDTFPRQAVTALPPLITMLQSRIQTPWRSRHRQSAASARFIPRVCWCCPSGGWWVSGPLPYRCRPSLCCSRSWRAQFLLVRPNHCVDTSSRLGHALPAPRTGC
jgi:hypothetical protein